jgi:hypothetical protein
MPLREFICYGTNVADLTPLQKCPLEALDFGDTRVLGLEAVKGLPLRHLGFSGCLPIKDLGPLAGLPLEGLTCGDTSIKDLAPLAKMPLTRLYMGYCHSVEDLGPLRGKPLTALAIEGTAVTDLTPVKGAPLVELHIEEQLALAQRQFLQALPKLETINRRPVRQFWADLDAKKPDQKP